MRVEAGAVVDEFELADIGQVAARHTRIRTADGGVTWACMFSVVVKGTSDLAVVHRLSAPSLAEARRCVRQAVEFLASRAMQVAPPSDPGAPSEPRVPSEPGVPSDLGVLAEPPRRRVTDTPPRIPVFELPSFDRPELPVDPQPAPLS